MITSTEKTDMDNTQNGTIESVHPSIKPPRLWIFIIIVVTGALCTGIATAFSNESAGYMILLIIAISAIFIGRYIVKILILRRTTYVINTQSIKREFSLFYETKSREIPLSQLRGVELSQSRLQTLLGLGTLRFLSGGTNQSLGYLTFENVGSPKESYSQLQDLINYQQSERIVVQENQRESPNE